MLEFISRFLLKLGGWTIQGEPPAVEKYVFIAAPHTSNWDGFLLVAFAKIMHLDIRWIIKESWTGGPLGRLLRVTGALGIDRSRGAAIADEIAKKFAEDDQLKLGIAPAGTRKATDYWKSGFYRIARAAGVPVVLSFVDYGRKEAGFGPVIDLTGDVTADMDVIRAFYVDKQAKFPKKRSRPRLRMEDEQPE
jgi:1-acyl-sn-glycerol-3-phosphate acyltransferase